jgi:8-oxo-dGTP pyrophosphatase MutT (NUDIX family)
VHLRFSGRSGHVLRTTKVLAYVTRGDELLVFTQPDSPESGVQVPAGTVRPGEALEAAVLREVEEETGLTGCAIAAYLGRTTYDMRALGRDELQERHVFHLLPPAGAPEAWTHYEEHDGLAPPEPFALAWRRLDDPELVLMAGQGAFLEALP